MNLSPEDVEVLGRAFDILVRVRAEAQKGRHELARQAGAELRKRRETKNLTLREMARQLELSVPFLSDVEHGRRRLSVHHAELADLVLGKKP